MKIGHCIFNPAAVVGGFVYPRPDALAKTGGVPGVVCLYLAGVTEPLRWDSSGEITDMVRAYNFLLSLEADWKAQEVGR